MMASRVSALPLLRFAENAMPTCENSRSTAADDAGQPRYCRAMTAKFGNAFLCSIHQSSMSCSDLYLICGSARYAANSSISSSLSSSSDSSSSESAKKAAALVLRRLR